MKDRNILDHDIVAAMNREDETDVIRMFMEVLLDIRDLLSKNPAPNLKETV